MAATRSRGALRAVNPVRTPAHEASVADAEYYLQTWTDEVLGCRSGLLQHNFEPYHAVHDRKLHYLSVVVRCPRCTTRKFFEVTENGQMLGQSYYRYPPGYLTKGIGKIVGDAKDRVRIEAIHRLFAVSNLTSKEAKDPENAPRPSTLLKLQGG